MRSFQILYILIFSLFFLVVAVASLKSMLSLHLKNIQNRHIKRIFWLIHALVFAGFVLLYIYPFHPRQATNYPLYFYYNAGLLVLLVFNSPLAIAFVLHRMTGRKTRIIPYAGFIVAVGLMSVLIYGVLLGSQELKVNQVTLKYPNLPPDFNNYKIVQISDIHAGTMLKSAKLPGKVKNEIKRLNPDLLLFTGDLVNNFAGEVDYFKSAIKGMNTGIPAYSILGNHDYGDYTSWESEEKKQSNFKSILNLHSEIGFTLLRNENVLIRQGKDSLFLAGVENWGHPPFPQYAKTEKALQGIPSNVFTLLMTHDPAHWESKVRGKINIELTFSGHTHGLQWGLKPAGIPFSMACFTSKYWGGIYRHGLSVLYVNTGLGMVGVPWRIDMPAEITLFTLKRGKVD